MKNLCKSYLTSIANVCCQCGHKFSHLDMAFDYLFNPKSKTITCPICGVENVR